MDTLAGLGRWAYPLPATRAHFDLPNILLLLLPLPLHLLSIHLLLRHPRSPLANALRTGLVLPCTFLASVRAGFGGILPPFEFGPNPGGKDAPSWLAYTVGGVRTEGGWQHFNVAIGIYGAYSIMKALEWGLATQPPRLRPELLDLVRATEGKGKSMGPDHLPRFYPGTRIPLGVDLLTNMRGIGWEWGLPYSAGERPSVQPARGSEAARKMQAQRAALIRSRLWLALRLFLFVDALDSLLKVPALFGPRANIGGPIALGGAATEGLRYEELPSWAAAMLTLMAGLVIPTSMQATYSLLSALALLPAHFFPDSKLVWATNYADPAYWGVPLLRSPHTSKDLRTLWGTDWHALFRAPFLAVAYRPVNNALKAIGLGADVPPTKKPTANGNSANGNGHDQSHSKDAAEAKTKGSGAGFWRGHPGKQLRRASSVLAVFFLSGLMHEAGQLAMARTPAERDLWRFIGRGEPVLLYAPPSASGALKLAYVDRGGRALAFFVMQGLACIVEDVVEMVLKGRRGRKGQASGAFGPLEAGLRSLWVAGWIFGWGHYVGKSWYRMGIAQGAVSLRATGALIQLLLRATRSR
ncbi:hypothetical protein OC834_002702 [Tilletia horrida]|nr:hypothetical protein OC834_002702 [Tilletia horrida]